MSSAAVVIGALRDKTKLLLKKYFMTFKVNMVALGSPETDGVWLFLSGLRQAKRVSNSYTTVCPPVQGDNPRAIVCRISPLQVDKLWYNCFILPHHYRPCSVGSITKSKRNMKICFS